MRTFFYSLIVVVTVGLLVWCFHAMIENGKKETATKLVENKQWNQEQFGHPELIATNTPKGNCYRVSVRVGMYHSESIYFFSNSSNDITINYFEGKGHRTVVNSY